VTLFSVIVFRSAPAQIINDPTIRRSRFSVGICMPWELELTRIPRLCDLMSPTGLAYLFLGIEPVERFNG
jgi:hypothetical protein